MFGNFSVMDTFCNCVSSNMAASRNCEPELAVVSLGLDL
jgi:hypothetical protein